METKSPTILLVLVETAKLRWYVAGLGLDGLLATLICSDEDDLSPYRGIDFDEQVAFLRHRFCGVLQRGCYRLWEQQKKACQFVFVFEGLLPESNVAGGPMLEHGTLTQRIAEHMVEWMMNPPIAVLAESAPGRLDRLAGTMEAAQETLLLARLAEVEALRVEQAAWDLVRQKGTWVQKTVDSCGG